MFTKINILDIANKHFRTLIDARTRRASLGDWLLFVGIPVLLGVAYGLWGPRIGDRIIGVLGTSVSIIAGLLFNLLILIYTIVDKEKSEKEPDRRKFGLLRETYINISFLIVVSIFIVVLLLVYSFALPIFWQVLKAIIAALTTSFTLTLFMVLKRVHTLVSHEIEG